MSAIWKVARDLPVVLATLGLDADMSTLALPANTTITAAGAAILNDANAVAQLATLGLQPRLDDMDNTPRIRFAQVASRGSIESIASATSDFIVFKSIYHVFDVPAKTTGAVYGLAAYYDGGTTQGVYKSLNGGVSWTKMGDLEIDESSGIWYEQIFVESLQETLYLLKTNNGNADPPNHDIVTFDSALTQLSTKNIGYGTWLTGNHNIDALPNAGWLTVVIFGEYDPAGLSATLHLWRTVDRGVTWTSVLSQTGNNGVAGAGEIRHFHTVAADPYVIGDWWAASGDTDSQSKIWRSQDTGVTWTLLFSGSQRERTCGFVFEPTCIYYGMDAYTLSATGVQIVRINRSDLVRTDVADVENSYGVFGLTRTWSPEGFVVWVQAGPNQAIVSDYIAVQFYDYRTEKLYTIGHMSTLGLENVYRGFFGGSRHQDLIYGNIFVQPTTNLAQLKYGSTRVSGWLTAYVSL